MLSVASLLNPVKSEPRGRRLPSSPSPSVCASSSAYGSPQLPTQSFIKKPKMTKDGAVFAKGKIKGEVNYPPFERLNEESMEEVQKFQVYPLGKIQEYCRHIPYNSEKKSFLERTGRESFEVFQYTFKVPGDDKEYCVMWDYNIGLVRITPFFKCCKYSKTTPAKMLNMNPGLKEITHSITGGALAAQGYWMPYSCALEVCATFCAHIAGALIPIFGPSFPSKCVSIEAPEHGRMIIDPQVVQKASAQSEAYRLRYSSFLSKASRESYSPQQQLQQEYTQISHNTQQPLGRRLRLKRTFGRESPHETTTDTDMGETSSGEGGYFHSNSPTTPVSFSTSLSRPRTWEHHNHKITGHSANTSTSISPPSAFKGPNPLLSAIPRSIGGGEMQMTLDTSRWSVVHHAIHSSKRRVEEIDADDAYDGGEESGSVTGTDDKGSVDGKASELGADGDDSSLVGSPNASVTNGVMGSTIKCTGGAEKKAAWLLMKLSVKDGECGAGSNCLDRPLDRKLVVGVDSDGPRIKRRRATSM